MMFKEEVTRRGVSEDSVPSGYQRVGDIVLLKFPSRVKENDKEKISKVVQEIVPGVKTVCEIIGVHGELREPVVRKIVGNETKTIHKEHNIEYELDVTKVMFSKGNIEERRRLIGKVKKNETVVDMFAGIGYFSLGISKFSKAKEVVAIEKNPDAFSFLLCNIERNGIKNITPILGACQEIAMEKEMENIADRVIMGYLPKTEKFLPAALLFLKKEGTIHFHNTYRDAELWEKPQKDLEKVFEGTDFSIENQRKVKEYAPGVWHIVMDISVQKN